MGVEFTLETMVFEVVKRRQCVDFSEMVSVFNGTLSQFSRLSTKLVPMKITYFQKCGDKATLHGYNR